MPRLKTHMLTETPHQALLVMLTLLLVTPTSALARGNFDQGSTRTSVSAASGKAFNSSYFVLGVGAGYYPIDGLEIGLDAKSWFGDARNVYDVSPSVTYIFRQFDSFQPYAGLLHRRTFIEGLDDRSAIGGRAGLFLQRSQNLLVRAGLVAIEHQNCGSDVYENCTEIYPEVSVGFYF